MQTVRSKVLTCFITIYINTENPIQWPNPGRPAGREEHSHKWTGFTRG